MDVDGFRVDTPMQATEASNEKNTSQHDLKARSGNMILCHAL